MISIAIATYNGERFLREQLDSLYRQTHLPDEVVVSDDGSTDGTLAILEEYHLRHGLKYAQNKGEHGVNRNFANALRMTTGDYICICDQDDIWFDNKVETLYAAIRKTDSSVPVAVSSSRQDVNMQGECITPPISVPYGEQWFDTFLNTGCSQGCTMILNRCLVNRMLDLYTNHPDAECYLYDVLASLDAAIFGQKINLGTPLMYYRHHDKNVVDKMRVGKYTFWQKVHDMPTYYPFLLDYRIHELAQANALYAKLDMRPEIRSFLDKMTQLDNASNICSGLRLVCSLSEISFLTKVKVILLTPVVSILKKIQKKHHYGYC